MGAAREILGWLESSEGASRSVYALSRNAYRQGCVRTNMAGRTKQFSPALIKQPGIHTPAPQAYGDKRYSKEVIMERVYRGEVWRAILDPATGSEQGGIRPVLILQNDMGNECSDTMIIAPVTTARRPKELPVHVIVRTEDLPMTSLILLEQIRVIDKCRIEKYIGRIEASVMRQVERAVLVSLGIEAVIE
jgi:mRNA interferase MazF